MFKIKIKDHVITSLEELGRNMYLYPEAFETLLVSTKLLKILKDENKELLEKLIKLNHEVRDVNAFYHFETAEVILNSDENCLIASPTASGKTEAALFPIITKMYNNPKQGIVTLYISPLKALINDQFLRLSESLEKGNIKRCFFFCA